jgi:hypothetical protein
MLLTGVSKATIPTIQGHKGASLSGLDRAIESKASAAISPPILNVMENADLARNAKSNLVYPPVPTKDDFGFA